MINYSISALALAAILPMQALAAVSVDFSTSNGQFNGTSGTADWSHVNGSGWETVDAANSIANLDSPIYLVDDFSATIEVEFMVNNDFSDADAVDLIISASDGGTTYALVYFGSGFTASGGIITADFTLADGGWTSDIEETSIRVALDWDTAGGAETGTVTVTNFSATGLSIPEPSSAALLLGAAGCLALRRRR